MSALIDNPDKNSSANSRALAFAEYERADAAFRASCMNAGLTQEDIAEIESYIAEAFGYLPDTQMH